MENNLRKLCAFIAFFFILIQTITSNAFAENDNLMVVTVQQGDTLSGILKSYDISSDDIFSAISSLKKTYDPSELKVGQKIRIHFDITKNNIRLNSIHIKASNDYEVRIQRFDDKFLSSKVAFETFTKLEKVRGKINLTLFSAIRKSGAPNSIREKFIKNYSYDVDFQRDIRKGDEFEILFERNYNKYGDRLGSGEIIYSMLDAKGQKIRMYNFETPDGKRTYYNEEGKSIQKSLLRTPIDGARITSGYGRREHPILGYSKVHKGIDFGASRGTPVYAAGDGIIIERARKGTYGKYIKIRHDGGYETAYAHLNGYAKRISRGSKVKQGQVIGYVGTTGRSTGPHLHYELLKDGHHINPLSFKTAITHELKSLELGIFNHYKKQIDDIMRSL